MNNNNNIINNDINFTDLLQSNMQKKILSYNHYSKSEYLSHFNNSFDFILKKKPFTGKTLSPSKLKFLSENKVSSSSLFKTYEKKTIKELTLNKINKKTFIIFNIFSYPLIQTKTKLIDMICEDENNDIIKISIKNYENSFKLKYNVQYKEVFKIGKFLIVFEPFYKLRLDEYDELIIEDIKNILLFDTFEELKDYVKINVKLPTVQEIKEKGNKFLLEKNYEKAISIYLKALEMMNENNNNLSENISEDNNHLKEIIYSNLSFAYLKLNAFTKSLESSEKSLLINNKNLKSLYRKINSLIGLKKYEECILFIKENNNILNTLSDINKIKEEIDIKLSCQIKGKFDYLNIFNQYEKNFNVDVADFINEKIKIDFDEEKGVKLVAKEKILKNELLFVQKSLEINIDSNNFNMNEGISEKIYNKLKISYEDFKIIFKLYNTNNKEISFDERKYKKKYNLGNIQNICVANTIVLRKFFLDNYNNNNNNNEIIYPGDGIFFYPSLMNHSCLDNTLFFIIGDVFICFAIDDIDIGNEITRSYFNCFGLDFDSRQNNNCIDFYCKCDLCKEEEKNIENNECYKKLNNFICEFKNNKNVINEIENFLNENKNKINFYEFFMGNFFIVKNIDDFDKKIKILNNILNNFDNNNKYFKLECIILYELYLCYKNKKLDEEKNKIINKLKEKFINVVKDKNFIDKIFNAINIK